MTNNPLKATKAEERIRGNINTFYRVFPVGETPSFCLKNVIKYYMKLNQSKISGDPPEMSLHLLLL